MHTYIQNDNNYYNYTCTSVLIVSSHAIKDYNNWLE